MKAAAIALKLDRLFAARRAEHLDHNRAQVYSLRWGWLLHHDTILSLVPL